MSAFITARSVAKSFSIREGRRTKSFKAIEDVSLTVEQGEFVAIVGRSGSGKSTILNLIAGLIPPDTGSVLYGGRAVTAVNTRVGYMTQRDNLLPWRSLWKNLALPLSIRHVPKARRPQLIESALEHVGLSDFRHHYPAQLSGGMRQRAALARMLIYEPETLLLDEPFGALDEHLKQNLQAVLQRLWGDNGKTVVYVTHDLGEAITLADRVIVFGGQPGTVYNEMTIPFPRPRDIYSLRYLPEFSALHRKLWEALGGRESEPAGTEPVP